jgi:threonine dehydratase
VDLLTLPDVEAACRRFDDPAVVRETPVESSRSLSALSGAEVTLKMGHLQRTGSFEARGAYNELAQASGQDTGSSGRSRPAPATTPRGSRSPRPRSDSIRRS